MAIGTVSGVLRRSSAFWVAGILFALAGIVLPSPSAASAGTLKWSTASEVNRHGGGQSLAAVACPTSSQRTSVDSNCEEVTFNPTNPGTPTPVVLDGNSFLEAVACPSASQCTAVGYYGDEITFNPTSPGTPTAVTIDNQEGLRSIACP